MNLPNLLTLSRIPLMFLIAALLLLPAEDAPPVFGTMALVVFIVAGLTDWLDGYIARKRRLVSNFGVYMDALSDKIFMLGAMVTLVALARHTFLLPLVLIILTRELLITGMRLIAANRGVVVAAEKAGKQKTVTQIIAVGVLFAEEMIHRDVAYWLSSDITTAALWTGRAGMVLFMLATYMTVRSGVGYLSKYRELWRD
jgi:CDP-diacylglycerol---glycerol-3-phosphate 3-phosphatidyltransferase